MNRVELLHSWIRIRYARLRIGYITDIGPYVLRRGLCHAIIQIMTFIREAIRDAPAGLWALDDVTSTLVEYSGHASDSGTLTGTQTASTPLINGVAVSNLLKTAVIATFPNRIFLKGFENVPFTLEANALVTTNGTTADVQILGNQNQMDGLMVNGTVVSFVTKYNGLGEARASYDISEYKKFHAVGVHTSSKNQLYIDGELVAEATITTAQQAGSYVNTSSNLYAGTTTSTSFLAVNGFATYSKALNASRISGHFQAINANLSGSGVATGYSGMLYDITENLADAFISRTFETTKQFKNASIRSVTTSNDQVRPSFNGTTSVASSWTASIPFPITSPHIYGALIYWDGGGVTIDASIDNGTTWMSIVEGQPLSILPSGFDTTGKTLYVRASFAGGIVNDISYLDNLRIVGYLTGTFPSFGNRTMTLTYPAISRLERFPNELSDLWGTVLPNTTSKITLNATTVGTDPAVKVVEFWAKRTSSTAMTIDFPGTIYSNGVSAANLTAALPVGEWRLIHIVHATTSAAAINITGPGIVGQIMTYAATLTTAQMKDILARYMGRPVLNVADSSAISIAEPTNAANMYTHVWEIVQSG